MESAIRRTASRSRVRLVVSVLLAAAVAWSATLMHVGPASSLPVGPPAGALPGRGGIDIALMATINSVLSHRFPHFYWTGFYRVCGTRLIVGPYIGTVGCLQIEIGRGVCGTSAAKRETIIVPGERIVARRRATGVKNPYSPRSASAASSRPTTLRAALATCVRVTVVSAMASPSYHSLGCLAA